MYSNVAKEKKLGSQSSWNSQDPLLMNNHDPYLTSQELLINQDPFLSDSQKRMLKRPAPSPLPSPRCLEQQQLWEFDEHFAKYVVDQDNDSPQKDDSKDCFASSFFNSQEQFSFTDFNVDEDAADYKTKYIPPLQSDSQSSLCSLENLKCTSVFREGNYFQVFVINKATSKTNIPFIFCAEEPCLYTKPEIEVRLMLGRKRPLFKGSYIQIRPYGSSNEHVKRRNICKAHPKKTTNTHFVMSNEPNTEYIVSNDDEFVTQIAYPFERDEPYVDLSFPCYNTCIPGLKKKGIMLDISLINDDVLIQTVSIGVKVCAAPARDCPEMRASVPDAGKLDVLSSIGESDARVYTVHIFGSESFYDVVKILRSKALSDRYILKKKLSNICHSSQLENQSDVLKWLNVLNMEKYVNLFKDNGFDTMQEIASKYRPYLFEKIGITETDAIILNKSFLNWSIVKLSNELGFTDDI